MRVIAGKYGSRPLRSLPGSDLRPTADKLRETLFNVLTAGNPAALSGTVWIDLFAGTGAVGIEALSREASLVYLVDSAAGAAQLIRNNLLSLKIESGFRVLQQNAMQAISSIGAEKVAIDFVFLDPPYHMEGQCNETLRALGESALLKAGSIVIAEHFKKFDPEETFGHLQKYRRLRQGDAELSFYRLNPTQQ